MTRLPILAVAAAVVLLTSATQASAPGADWNESTIAWLDFESGIQRIERTGQPGLLVFYTNWCPHCTRYSGVFHDRGVAQLARDYVMIRVDRDQADQLNKQYSKNGSYVPRTLFLDSNGEVDWTVVGRNPKYPYFLDTEDPSELVGLMEQFAGN